jgi:peroxiredoxin
MRTKFSKLLLILIFIPIIIFSQKKGTGYVLTGKIQGLNAGTKVLLSFSNDKQDSVIAEEGLFRFTGVLKEPIRVFVMIRQPKLAYRSFWLENSVITLEGDLKALRKAKVTGSATEALFAKLDAVISPKETMVESLEDALSKAVKNNDATTIDSMKNHLQALNAEIKTLKTAFVKSNPSSYVAVETLYFTQYDLEKKELGQLYKTLNQNLRNTERGKLIAEYISLFSNPQLGKKAPGFAIRDNNNKRIELSQFKGKYVLLEFWANWCAPCLEELPNLLATYDAFKDKGFEVVAISADNKKYVWLESLKSYKMKWVNALEGGDNKAATIYGVNSYPDNFLIAPDGTIIARKLRGEELRKKLEELIK